MFSVTNEYLLQSRDMSLSSLEILLLPISLPSLIEPLLLMYDILAYFLCIALFSLSFLLFRQGAFYALRPEDLRRRPDVFVGVAA